MDVSSWDHVKICHVGFPRESRYMVTGLLFCLHMFFNRVPGDFKYFPFIHFAPTILLYLCTYKFFDRLSKTSN